MDKWKDLELEKMKVGGNYNARCFFESQEDYDDSMTLSEKYNSKAAALYRDKVRERRWPDEIFYYMQCRSSLIILHVFAMPICLRTTCLFNVKFYRL